jgi:tetratricopeptide (TPR) repeat protein
MRLLVRWADAVAQGGRPREAIDSLDAALDRLRAGAETETIAQDLATLSRASGRVGDGRTIPLAVEAVNLLERQPPGPVLVAAYTQLAAAQWLSGSHAKGIAAADRAIALASELGLPEPARALGYRGMARAYLGEAGAITAMEDALAKLLENGAGRDAAIVQNNLAISRYPIEGVAASLSGFDAGIEFCRQRGLVEAESVIVTNRIGLLVEVGRPEEALAQASQLSSTVEMTSLTDLVELRAVELNIRVARGERPSAAEIDWLVKNQGDAGHIDVTTFALACAAGALSTEAPDRSRQLLAKLAEGSGRYPTPYFARTLPAMVRTALVINDDAVATKLIERLGPRYPLDEHALRAARAALAEAAGNHAEAATLYADAAERWQRFGNVPERAFALLGHGRCLIALGSVGAEVPLAEARDLFTSMGYKPALAETEALLANATTLAS